MTALVAPELETAMLYRQLITARRNTEAAGAHATQAVEEAITARLNLARLEDEYRDYKKESTR